MLRIIEGNPGSGKSYYAVNYLRKFCIYEKLYQQMNLNPDVLLVTNVDDIKVPHKTWLQFENEGLFDIKNLQAYIDNHNYRKIIIIIDECQNHFGGLKDNNKFFFFEYHRHLGMDLFLICQTISALPRRLVELSEFIIRAKSRVYTIAGFAYSLVGPRNGEIISSIHLRPDQSVFKLYKSFNIDEDSKAKPKKIIRNKYIILAITVILILAGMKYYLSHGAFIPKTIKAQTNETKKETTILPEENKEKKSIFDKSTIQDKETAPNNLIGYTIHDKFIDIKPNGKTIKGVCHVGDRTYIYR